MKVTTKNTKNCKMEKAKIKPRNPALRKTAVTTSASPKLKHLVVIGKFSDGKCRQVLINPKTQDVILSAILACEGSIRALETTLEGIDIMLPS